MIKSFTLAVLAISGSAERPVPNCGCVLGGSYQSAGSNIIDCKCVEDPERILLNNDNTTVTA